ncbi:MAG: complex I subunit 5 family protein [Eubacterium sp.]
MLAIPIFLPLLSGFILFLLSTVGRKWQEGITKKLSVIVMGIVLLTAILHIINVCCQMPSSAIWYLKKDIPILLSLDDMGMVFSTLVVFIWILVTLYTFSYMNKDKKGVRFLGCHLMTLGTLMGITCAGNLVTMYIFYEGMTLATIGYVVHAQTKEAIAAGYKYVFYSIIGAFLGLIGFFYIYQMAPSIAFTPGGVFHAADIAGHEKILQIAVLGMIIGFGSKAGMFPLHGWLSTAHPVAPAPASAILSGINTKMGVLAIIRVIYYIAGADFLRHTFVQYIAIGLTLLTVFMGSMLAYKEKIMKRRLAYSTVSQVSYVLFGIMLLHPLGLLGTLLHVIYHSVIKNNLFMCAGAVIHETGTTRVEGYCGMGKRMPITMTCFTMASLALVGIPPFSGFVSKWKLGIGALLTQIPGASIAGPIVLLVSALLTAGYLLTVSVHAFYDKPETEMRVKEDVKMVIPMVILAALALLLGIFAAPLIAFMQNIVNAVM